MFSVFIVQSTYREVFPNCWYFDLKFRLNSPDLHNIMSQELVYFLGNPITGFCDFETKELFIALLDIACLHRLQGYGRY